MSSFAGDHWLYQWMDEFEIDPTQNEALARGVFSSPTAVHRLYDLATAAHLADNAPVEEGSAVVSRTLDLSGPFTCNRLGCMKQRLDRSLLSTFHYFDSVVVTGPPEYKLARLIGGTPKSQRQKRLIEPLLHYMSLFSYIRSIGATDLLVFRKKDYDLCECCTEKQAGALGLSAFKDPAAKERLHRALSVEAEIAVRRRGSKQAWHCEIEHESLPETFMFELASQRKPSTEEVVNAFMRYGALALLQDLHLSRSLRLPLVQEFRASVLGGIAPAQASAEDVAIGLELPYLDGINAPDLIAAMRDEKPSFERFRAAVRKGVQEKVSRLGDASPDRTSHAVMKDIIEPSVADLENRLNVAKRALTRKSVAGVAIGTALVTAGVITAMPLVIGAAGVTIAAGSLLQDLKKYTDDRGSIELEDMYFLWYLGNHVPKQH